MKAANLIALACGVVIGAALANLAIHGNRPSKPPPSALPAFHPQFTPEFRATLVSLQGTGETGADLANLVVAEFDRQWNRHAPPRDLIRLGSRSQPEARAMDAGRQAAVDELLGRDVFPQWKQQAVLRCLRPGELVLNPAEASRLYEVWRTWDSNESFTPLPNEHGDDALWWHRGLRDQLRQAQVYSIRLQRLLGPERYAVFARAHLASTSAKRVDVAIARPLTAREQIAIEGIEMQMWDRYWTYLINHKVTSFIGQNDALAVDYLESLWKQAAIDETAALNRKGSAR